jgi:membrane dipeptidase
MDARDLLRDAVVVDGHTDLPSRLYYRPADLGERLASGHVDLPRMKEGGVAAVVAALYVPSYLGPERGWRHALALHEALAGQLRPGRFEQAVTAEDVRRLAAAGTPAAILALENGRPLLVPGALGECARLGVRYVTLTHVGTHEWCDAAGDEVRHGGLSDPGVKIVRELRRHGILTDVSHVSDDAVLHALDALRGPVVASHSSARARCDHPRNLPDGLVREIARGGGVVMANSYPAFIGPEAAAANARRLERVRPVLEDLQERAAAGDEPDPVEVRARIGELLEDQALPPVPLAAYVDHVVHLVEVAGEEHVGIGTDFDGITDVLVGFEDVSRFPALVQALLDRGLAPAAVRLLLGENFLRLLADAERRAD